MYLMILYFRWSGRGGGGSFFVSLQTQMWNNINKNKPMVHTTYRTLKHELFLTSWALIFQCKNTCFTIKPAHFPKNNKKKIFPGLSLFSGEAGFFLSNLPHIDSLCSNAVRKKWRKGHEILASDINASSHIQGDLHTIVQRIWRFL